MATFTRKKNAVVLGLDNGTDSEGNQRVKNQTLTPALKATLDLTDSTTLTNLLTVISALGPTLDKEIYSITGTITGTITAA